MTASAPRQGNPWVAVRPGDDVDLLARRVSTAHRSFVEDRSSSGNVRSVILDSWLRSRIKGVDPDGGSEQPALSGAELDRYRDAHPMAMLCGTVGAMSSFYHSDLDVSNPEERMRSAHRLIAKMPTLVAMCYKYNVGQPFVYPRNDLSYAANFLNMMFSVPAEEYQISPAVERAMDRIFTLHADHEQNASTSTVRLAGSSGANPYACISAGVASLWGPAHGGANEACLNMLEEIGTVDRIPEFIARAKDKNDPFRLMGFGHRVYKNHDPRATVMRESCHEVLSELNVKDPLLEVAMELEKIALSDPYFAEKKLFPNVDFYSGIVLKAIGIPTNMFTCIFALSRTVGWISHWHEMMSDPKQKIGRPRQLYTGHNQRKYTPIK